HRTQESRRVKGAGPYFHLVGPEDHAALIRPVPLQREDQLLEGARRAADFHGRWPFLAPKERASIRRGGPELRAAAEAAVPHQKRARERLSERPITGLSCLAHVSGAIIAALRTRSGQNRRGRSQR